ncbi:MAG TPA: FTR1 family protein [Candidatus Nanopelagicaceae bacterium]|nr:FTR1 family protein [Candidatus Nanopelagicaceae bacterium]
MLPTFVIFLREGVEASMIVAILLAYLARSGHREYFRDVYAGVAAALALAFGGGAAAFLLIRTYEGSRAQTIFETATFLLACGVLTYMTFWMHSHARTLSRELKAKADQAMGRGARLSLALVAFQAVGREGLETVVFTLAIFFAASSAGGNFAASVPAAALGAALGVLGALAIAYVVYRLGHRLNLGRFFQVIGSLLMLFAAGLLADAIENLQQLHWLPLLAHPLWNTSSWLTEGGALGDILHTFLGYASQPTGLQVVIYWVYVLSAVGGFFWISGRHRPARPTAATATG